MSLFLITVPDKQAVILTLWVLHLGRGKVEQILCAWCAQKLSVGGSWQYLLCTIFM